MPFKQETPEKPRDGWHVPRQPDMCRWRCLICRFEGLSKDPASTLRWHWRLAHEGRAEQ